MDSDLLRKRLGQLMSGQGPASMLRCGSIAERARLLAQVMAATVMGQAMGLRGEPLAAVSGVHLSRRPPWAGFAASATCAFLELCANRDTVAQSFQDVTAIDRAQFAGQRGLSPVG